MSTTTELDLFGTPVAPLVIRRGEALQRMSGPTFRQTYESWAAKCRERKQARKYRPVDPAWPRKAGAR